MAFLPVSRLRALVAPVLIAIAAPAVAAPADTSDTVTVTAPALPDMSLLIEKMVDRIRFGADLSNRMTLPVEIAGDGPYAFIVDTESQRSIVATELAQHLALRELPPVQIVSMAGKATVASVHLDELRFGKQELTNVPALSIAHEHLGGAGLIGLDGLKDKRVTLDFREQKMEISQSAPARAFRRDPNVIVVQARSKLGQLILVDSKIDGERVNVILDTGAEMSVGNMALFHKLKRKRLVIPPRPIMITAVTGKAIQAQFTVVRHITIESVQLSNVPMVFVDAAPFAELDLQDRPAMLLGMQMLRMFNRVAIDFGSRHVDFELPRSDNDRRAADRLMASL